MMEYSVQDLIGMLNLGVIIANGCNAKEVKIPKDAVSEILVYLHTLEMMQESLQENV